MRVQVYHSFKALPETYRRLDRAASAVSFSCSLAWYRNLLETEAGADTHLQLFGLETETGVAQALLVCRQRKMPLVYPYHHRLESLTNLYSLDFAPLIPTCAGPAEKWVEACAEAFVGQLKGDACIKLDCWDPNSPFYECVYDALRRRGFIVHDYFQFSNVFETVVGDTWASFLSRRSSRLRNLLKRKMNKLSLAGHYRFEIIQGGPSLKTAIEAYQTVYRASWKPSEPYPSFIPGLIKTAAQAGWLNLGLLWLDDEPIAAQIWLVAGGCATIYKLAHAENHQSLSPGSLLTGHMFCKMLEVEKVAEVDFGRGGEPYKRLWLHDKRERCGLLAFNRRHPGALVEATYHLAGKRLRSYRAKIPGYRPA